MAVPVSDIAASLKGAMSERLSGALGNAALHGLIAVFVLTAWVACVAGLVAVLAPLWGLAAAIFLVALLVFVMALILLAVVKRRARLQRERAASRQAETMRQAQAALVAALPGLLRHRSGALIVGLGLAIGAVIVAALQEEEEG